MKSLASFKKETYGQIKFMLLLALTSALYAILLTNNGVVTVLRSSRGFTQQLAPEKKALKGSRHKWAKDLNDEMPGHKMDGESKNSASPGSELHKGAETAGSNREKPSSGRLSFVDRQRPVHNWNALGDDVIRFIVPFFLSTYRPC